MESLTNANISFNCNLLISAAILFLTAGTIKYMNGWIFIILFFVPMFSLLCFFALEDLLILRELNDEICERIGNKSYMCYFLCLGASGLDYRFGWTLLPEKITIYGIILMLAILVLSIAAIAKFYLIDGKKSNRNNCSTLKGKWLYNIFILLMFLSFQLILGSGIGLAICIAQPFLLIMHIRNEEK